MWHIPLYGLAGFVVPLVLAFFYTVVQPDAKCPAMHLLHGSSTAAQDHLLLSAASCIVDVVLLGTYVVGAVGLIAVTRGRLGASAAKTREAESEEAVQ